MKQLRRNKPISIKRIVSQLRVFFKKNVSLVFFTALMVFGVLIGCFFYSVTDAEKQRVFIDIASYKTLPLSVAEGCRAVVAAAFYPCVVLAIVFLFGLTPYGCPLILLAPLFFGFCLGVTECHIYNLNTWLFLVTDFLPHVTVSAVAVLIACIQAVKMSCVFSRQLLPNGANCGGMWQDFKVYLLRFLLCVLLAFIAATINVVLQIF